MSTLDATFAIAFLSFDTANRARITEQPGLLTALVSILDPNATDTDSTFADEHDLVVRFALSAISQLALDKHSRIALAKEKNAIKFIFARARNESKEAYIRMTAMIALSNLLLEGSVCFILLADKTIADELVDIATTVPVVEDVKRKSSAALSLDYALNALYNLCVSTAWPASKFTIKPEAHQRLLAIASGNPQFQSVYLADRVASCIDPLRALSHPDVSSSPFVFGVLPGTSALGEVAGGVGDFFSTVFAKTKSGLSSVGDATGISKAVDAAATGLDKAKSSVVDAVVAPMQQPDAAAAADSTSASANPFVRAFDAVKSSVTAIGDKVVDVAKAGADAAKSGVSAAADATSAGLNMAVDAAKAGADAAKSGVNAATSVAASVVPGSSQPQQDLAHTAPAAVPPVPDLKNGPSVKALAGKFAANANPDSSKLRSPRERSAFLKSESAVPPPPQLLHGHGAIIFDVSPPVLAGAGGDVYHC